MRKQELKHIKKAIPFVGYDEPESCLVCRDQSYVDIYRILPRDLVNSDTDEIEMDCFRWAKFYKTYGMDLEIATMMFPADTRVQQQYWQQIGEANRNPLYREMLQRKIEELRYREQQTARKEFFLLFFFESKERIGDCKKVIDSTLGIGRAGMVEEITKEKKLQILFKLGNKNSMIF